MKFGERLKILRKEKGYSQQEVADRIGITLRAYSAYENKNVRPRKMETYEMLADVLGCDVNDLIIEESSKTSPLYYTGLGLVGLGAAFTGPIGAIAGTAVVAYSFFKHRESEYTYEEWAKYQNRLAEQYEKKLKQFEAISLGVILSELGKRGIKCQVGDVKDLVEKGSVPDEYILTDHADIKEWWFVFWCKENRENEQFNMFDRDRAYILFNRFCPTRADPKRKASIILNDEELFDELCKLKNCNSYRGNLTVVLINTEDATICKEETLSYYDMDEIEDKLPIIERRN